MYPITIALVFGSAIIVGAKIADDNLDRNNYVDSYRGAKILNQNFENFGEGPYLFNFATSDGTQRTEEGSMITTSSGAHSMRVTGSYKYVDIDGNTYDVKYVADENGFRPEATHIKSVPFNFINSPEQPDDTQITEDDSVSNTTNTNKNDVESKPALQPTPPQPFATSGQDVEQSTEEHRVTVRAKDFEYHPETTILPVMERRTDESINFNVGTEGQSYATHVNGITDGVELQDPDESADQLIARYLFGGELEQQQTIGQK